ncbi:MAG: protein kinase, partial [Acidobacteriia bacterium]|nr:protein kinase [Terriglobia bacterium]
MRVGETVGDYRIKEELGRGAVGRVFRVEHVLTQRQEAMKVLAGVSLREEEVAQRFLREIRVQASLSHPQIAAVHNAFCWEEQLVMVMELVAGQPLSSLMEHGAPEWREGVRIIRQVLSALSYAHAKGVIHRDVSPANIIVGPDGRIKITDFGLACVASDPRFTLTGCVFGSVHYMAPEQVKGADRAEARSDLYACGAVLYEAVTARKPFPGDNAFDVMQAHVMTPPIPPVRFNSALPVEISDAILKAMSKEPEQRFASAAEFLEELARVMMPGGAPARAIRRAIPKEAAPAAPVRKNRWTVRAAAPVSWAMGLVVGILLVSLLSYGTRLFYQQEKQVVKRTPAAGKSAFAVPDLQPLPPGTSPAEPPKAALDPPAASPAKVRPSRPAMAAAPRSQIHPVEFAEPTRRTKSPPKADGALPALASPAAMLPVPKVEAMSSNQAHLTNQSWESAATLMQPTT